MNIAYFQIVAFLCKISNLFWFLDTSQLLIQIVLFLVPLFNMSYYLRRTKKNYLGRIVC